MTAAEAERIGRAWVDAGGPVLPGMLVQLPALGSTRAHEARVVSAPAFGTPSGWGPFGLTSIGDGWPDPRDAATVGAMLGAVREAYNDPGLSTGCTDGTRWAVQRTTRRCFAETLASGRTEPEALIAAWKARPTGGTNA